VIIALQTIDPGVVDELIDTRSVTGWDYLWAFLTVVTAFLVAWLAKKALGRGLKAFEGIPPRIASLITTATTWSIRLLGVVFALPFLGVDIGPVVIFIIVILALLVIAGRVILENFSAGLILQTRAPFKVGDEITSLEYSGRVEDINGRSVVITSDSGERVAPAARDLDLVALPAQQPGERELNRAFVFDDENSRRHGSTSSTTPRFGKVSRNSAPSPGADVTSMSPACASTIFFEIDRPRPVPSTLEV